MLSPYIHVALAHERHQTLLAQAETDRRPGRRGCTGGRRTYLMNADRRCAGALAWLQSGRSGLLDHWPRCAVTGRPKYPRRRPRC